MNVIEHQTRGYERDISFEETPYKVLEIRAQCSRCDRVWTRDVFNPSRETNPIYAEYSIEQQVDQARRFMRHDALTHECQIGMRNWVVGP